MQYQLTLYSHGAGCGCKSAPKVLDQILQHHAERQRFLLCDPQTSGSLLTAAHLSSESVF
jgi:selenophosphate synthase